MGQDGRRTELKQPEHDISSDEDAAVNPEVPLTVFFPVQDIDLLGDAVVNFRVANLVEERIDEKRAGGDAEP